MGSVVKMPVTVDFALRGLTKLARIGLAARWIETARIPAGERWWSRIYFPRLLRTLLPLDRALCALEQDAERLCAELNDGQRSVYHAAPVVLYVRRRGRVIVIEDFILAGLERTLATLDSLAARVGR